MANPIDPHHFACVSVRNLVGMVGVIAGVLFVECRPFERVSISARSGAVSAHDETGLLTRKR